MATAVICSGCSTSTEVSFSTDDVESVTQRYPAPDGVSIVSWLLDGDGDWAHEITLAGTKLDQACMVDRGFPGYPRAAPPNQGTPLLSQPLRPLSVDAAAVNGYELVDQFEGADTWVDPVTAYFDSLSHREKVAFQVAVGECAELVREALFDGAFEEYESARQLLESKMVTLFDAFYASSEVRDVFAAWSNCMDAQGFDAADPFDAMEQAATAERAVGNRIASADATCRSDLGTERAVAQLFRAAESNFLVENETLVLDVITLSGRRLPETAR